MEIDPLPSTRGNNQSNFNINNTGRKERGGGQHEFANRPLNKLSQSQDMNRGINVGRTFEIHENESINSNHQHNTGYSDEIN